uniref:Uncharacterized protein n=1 Tax=viral metagenome TaxID=1070528 RepID=A0A2V0RAB6_9ZZZZ
MELPLDIRISARQRDGFRSSSAPWILQGMPRKILKMATEDEVPEDIEEYMKIGDQETRRDELARRMGVSGNVIWSELNDLIYDMNERIHPGTLDLSEIRKVKGKIDLQSVVCTILANKKIGMQYFQVLDKVYQPKNTTVTYTKPSSVYLDHNSRLQIVSGTRLLDYLTTPSDLTNVIDNFKLRLHVKDKAMILLSRATVRKGRIDIALNLSPDDDKFLDAIEHISSTDHITYGQDNIIAPFVIESMGIDNGTIVIHIFSDVDGSALEQWMAWCSEMFQRMLYSVISTLRDGSQAYYSPGLGGQFPIQFFRAFKGTVAALNREVNFDRIPDKLAIEELLHAYARSKKDRIMDERLDKVFGNTSNLESFLTHFLIFVQSFIMFNKIATYNERDDRGRYKSTEERLNVSRAVAKIARDGTGLISMKSANDDFASNTLKMLKTASPDSMTAFSTFIETHISDIRAYM